MSGEGGGHIAEIDRHVVERLSAEAPLRESALLVLTEGYEQGDEFVVIRSMRGVSPLPTLRWDACLVEVTPYGPHMAQVGFGLTQRAAMRRMKRDKGFHINRRTSPGKADPR